MSCETAPPMVPTRRPDSPSTRWATSTASAPNWMGSRSTRLRCACFRELPCFRERCVPLVAACRLLGDEDLTLLLDQCRGVREEWRVAGGAGGASAHVR